MRRYALYRVPVLVINVLGRVVLICVSSYLCGNMTVVFCRVQSFILEIRFRFRASGEHRETSAGHHRRGGEPRAPRLHRVQPPVQHPLVQGLQRHPALRALRDLQRGLLPEADPPAGGARRRGHVQRAGRGVLVLRQADGGG